MLNVEKVSELYARIEEGIDCFAQERGEGRMKVGELVDFVLAYVTACGNATREEILEAWVYVSLTRIVTAGGVQPLRVVGR